MACFGNTIMFLSVILLTSGALANEDTSALPGNRSHENLIVNGSFDEGMNGWGRFWTRAGQGNVEVLNRPDTAVTDRDGTTGQAEPRSGNPAAGIRHRGDSDWSFTQSRAIHVVPGQIYDYSARLSLTGPGAATLCVTLMDANDKAINWAFGARQIHETKGVQLIATRFLIPHGAAKIVARLIGQGDSHIVADSFTLRRTNSLPEMRDPSMPTQVTASNDVLKVVFKTVDARFTIHDKRTNRIWTSCGTSDIAVLAASTDGNEIHLSLLKPNDMLRIACQIQVDESSPEFTVEMTADGEMLDILAFPPPIATCEGEFLIMPVNEGISYPVVDTSLPPMRYHLFGGHGLSMPWYGATDLREGLMSIVETADDAWVKVDRNDDLLVLSPQWVPQLGKFGAPRRIRYIAFEKGGYVAMCKRYRSYAEETGLLKTLAEKRERIPSVDRLVGAANIWCFHGSPSQWCDKLRKKGIDRILWSRRTTPGEIDLLNQAGILTGRYDIYQDAMNPAEFPNLHHIHPDWTSDAWPDGLMVDENGDWRRGWRVTSKSGEMIPCGVLCDSRAVDSARLRVPEELKTHAYRARFVDTTTASPWRECYHPDHPMSRSESKYHKMQLLRYMSEECGLVTGSETGHDAAVPYLHFFEGMMSLGPYRIPDAGRRMIEPVDPAPERVAKFQTGHYYRLPLWELVYHDCVISYWYWGDYNNKLPSLWDRRDLLNMLYGTPPMFMFNEAIWREHEDRFAESYQAIAPLARSTGYREMLSHRWLTDDHTVQQTQFSGKIFVTVNFGDKPYRMQDGRVLAPMAYEAAGLDQTD